MKTKINRIPGRRAQYYCIICQNIIFNRNSTAKYCKECANKQPWLYRINNIK